MGTVLKIHEQPLKLIVLILKHVFDRLEGKSFDLNDLNLNLKKLGIRTELNLDVTFIYECLKINHTLLDEQSLTVDNVKIPELKEVTVEYYQTFSETKTYYYSLNVETYSSDRKTVFSFFEYDGSDYVEPLYGKLLDSDTTESEIIDEGINNIY